MRARKNERSALALELEDLRVCEGEIDLFGYCAFDTAKLERTKSVTVPRAVRIGRVGLEIRPDHPADFAVGDCAFADEFCAAAQNEIALHLFPDEMKLIRAEPHVRARASECVFLRGGIVSCRTGQLRGADVGLAAYDSAAQEYTLTGAG